MQNVCLISDRGITGKRVPGVGTEGQRFTRETVTFGRLQTAKKRCSSGVSRNSAKRVQLMESRLDQRDKIKGRKGKLLCVHTAPQKNSASQACRDFTARLTSCSTAAACSAGTCGPMGRLKTVSAKLSASGNLPRFQPASAYAPDKCGGTG